MDQLLIALDVDTGIRALTLADQLRGAAGGFKISFAVAHLMAKAVIAQTDGAKPDFLPDIFMPGNRLKPRLDRAP